MKSKLVIIIILLVFITDTVQAQKNLSKTKSLSFKSATVGDITYMTQNLNVSTFRDGSPIPEAKNSEEWMNYLQKKKPAFCYFNYNSKNDKKYGKLYNYYALTCDKGLAPIGWHIPNVFELNLVFKNTRDDISSTFTKPSQYTDSVIYIFKQGKCYPQSIAMLSNDRLTKLSSSYCDNIGIFKGQPYNLYSLNSSVSNIINTSTSSWWSGSWWTNSKITTADKNMPLVLNTNSSSQYDNYYNNYFATFESGSFDFGRSVICVKDYPIVNKEANNDIIIDNKIVISNFVKIDSVVKDLQIKKKGETYVYYYKGFAENNYRYRDPAKVFIIGNKDYISHDSIYRIYRIDNGTKEGSRQEQEIEINYRINPDSIVKKESFDTIYTYHYVYSYEGNIYTPLTTFSAPNVKVFTKWGNISTYNDKEIKEFILSSLPSNVQFLFLGVLKDYLDAKIKTVLDNIELAVDISPFRKKEALNLKIGNIKLPLNSTENTELITFKLNQNLSIEINNTGTFEFPLEIFHDQNLIFSSIQRNYIYIESNCDYNVPRKDYYILKTQIKIDKKILQNYIYHSHKKTIEKFVNEGSLLKSKNYYTTISHTLPLLNKVDHKTNFDTLLSEIIATSNLSPNILYNELINLFKIDSLKNWSRTMIVNHFKRHYLSSDLLLVYNSLDRKIKDICKGLYIIWGNGIANEKLLQDNDINSYDCQILNSVLIYKKEYPNGHSGRSEGAAPPMRYNSGKIGFFIHNGSYIFLPSPYYFDCERYPSYNITSSLNYIKRALALRPKATEGYLFKALYTARNSYQKYVDQCTVSDICSQCDVIEMVLKNKNSLPKEYYTDLDDYYQLSCIRCSLCNYNVCGGSRPTKKDGTLDMRYKINR